MKVQKPTLLQRSSERKNTDKIETRVNIVISEHGEQGNNTSFSDIRYNIFL